MLAIKKPNGAMARLQKDEDSNEFRLIFMVSFIIFLVGAIVMRLLPKRWRFWPVSVEGRRSIVAEARAAAYALIPFVYMA